MPARVRSQPVLALLAVASAILIVVGRMNRQQSWGDWVFIAGVALLVVAGVLYLVARR